MCEKCNKKPYYITTAIAYTSRKPHIGNSYEIVLTDALARYKRLQGRDVFFLTGTDEHGQKIEEIAKAAGISPKEHVDKVAGEIKDICKLLNISNDKFIRTTDDYHEKVVQKIFKKLYEQGDIYKSEYEGLYCTPCESFWTESQLVDGKCPDCGRPVKKAKEEAYFFRLSKYQKQLEEYIENNPDFIFPESRKKEMLNNFIKPGLQDLCVSRTSFKWGVPVDFDDKHVVYVWIDALSNYITALGYDPDGSSDMYKKYWPADVHIIGKDILRFHTIYWPIMLMALGEPLPKQVFGHPWLLFGNDKMSKSKGNVIYADDLVAKVGVDAVRYYLLSEMPYANDGSITYETIFERYNSDLANNLGNLVNRTISMSHKYFDGKVLAPTCKEDLDNELSSMALETVAKVDKLLSTYRVADAIEAVFNLAKRCNKYIDETAPWVLAKDEDKKERLATVLYNLLEGIRFVATLLTPFMPDTADSIFSQLNCSVRDYDSLSEFGKFPVDTQLNKPVALFGRIDAKKELEKLAAEREALAEASEPKKEEKKAKKEEKKQEKKADENSEAAPKHITIDDFAKVKVVCCKVVDCVPVENTDKLLKFKLDDGTENGRQIVSSIHEYYEPSDLIGKKIMVVGNLKPAKFRGVRSEGMLIACDVPKEDGSTFCQVIFLDDSIPAGTVMG